MTHDEIIAMAREAQGYKPGEIDPADDCLLLTAADALSFAALVAAKEREACAEIAEKEDVTSTDDPFGVQSCIADAIRARGQKEGA